MRLRLLADFGVNSFESFVPGMVKQYVAVNREGFFIGDAILFHLGEGLLDLVGASPVLDWVQFQAETGAYDVKIERDENSARRQGPPKLYRYELQGPTAVQVIEQLTGSPLPDVAFFGMTDFRIAGHDVRALRHGMAGQPGFELFGPWQEGADVLAALLAAGARARTRPRGSEGVLDRQPRIGLDPEAAVGDLRRGGEGVPRVAPGGGRGLARREHGLGRHHRLLRHPIRHRLWAARQVRSRLPRP